MPGIQFPAIVNLTDLNGANGFKIVGEAADDGSGISVNSIGDINGDGRADLLIGAPYHNNTGRSYVVFGGPGVGSGGEVALSSLNGTNGFKLDGETVDESGYSVSSAGDINGDGWADLLIGAYGHNSSTGCSYVVYGGPGIGSGGEIALSSLNGMNGFKLDGEAMYDDSGASVSSAGDINGDGWADLLIGAYGHNSYTGRSYVVFGGPGVGGGGVLALSSLNGTNGFKLDGEATNDYSGFSVSSAGDINGDGWADLIIGAFRHNSNTGRSYVVFGGPGVGGGGVLTLSSLNGTNGFKLDGEVTFDLSGYSVSSAGDINGDGLTDLIIGAYGHNSATGRSYAVFGGPGVGNSGLISLSNLNGTNGFKLDGEAKVDWSGRSVSSAGDINGDGWVDLLIGAYGHNSITGRSYAVFGGPGVGSGGVLALSSLNGANGFKLDGEAIGDYSGYSVSSAGDINGDGRADLLIGAYGHNGYTGRSYVVFSDAPPVLQNNRLVIHQGEKLEINAALLNATDVNYPPDQMNFTISQLQHGQFQLAPSNVSVLRFNEQSLLSGQVFFAHDNSAFAPAYQVSVRDPLSTSATSNAAVTFYRWPVLQSPALVIHQNETALLTQAVLNVTDDYPASQVNFTISNLQHGQFILLPLNNSVTQFTQQQLFDNQTYFVQDGSTQAPSYQVSISDPYFALPAAAANVTFYRKLVWVHNQLSINQGQTAVLDSTALSVVDDYPPAQVSFTLTAVQHGQFTLLPSNQSVTQFTEAQLTSGQVMFTQDGSSNSPSYSVSVSDPYFALTPVPAAVTFYRQSSWAANNLITYQGGSLSLDPSWLVVSDDYPSNQVTFTVSNVQHGQFKLMPANNSVVSFTEQQLQAGQVFFVQDGTDNIPSYQTSVSDPYFTLAPEAANVTFALPPVFSYNRLTIASSETVVLTAANLRATDTVTPEDALVFTVSKVQHGYFAQVQVPNTAITHFTQGSISATNIEFIADDSQQAPSYSLTVTDSLGLSTGPDQAQITFNGASSSASNNTVRNAIIGGVVSGVIGLGFFALKLWIGYRAQKQFDEAITEEKGVGQQQADYRNNVIRPIAKEILERIQVAGFMGYINDITMKEAIGAISMIVHELSQQGVEVDLRKLADKDQNRLLDTIARQTRRILVPEVSACSQAQFSRFFCPEVTPRQIEDNAAAIASAVRAALKGSVSPSEHVELQTLTLAQAGTGGAGLFTQKDADTDMSPPSPALPTIDEGSSVLPTY